MAGESGPSLSLSCGDESGALSPKNKVKFLCSHCGKVLPRPSDGLLKYVGGETRVISVPRDITFSDLMKKLSGMVDGDMVLKYQLIPEDLDTLVSVRTDEDLKHMIDEHDRHESGGAPLLRAFLFPSKPVLVVDNHAAAAAAATESYVLEQRYIDAINGVIRTSPKAKLSSIRAFSTSSACSSPKSNSPDGHTADLAHESVSPFQAAHPSSPGWVPMHKVRSSPSITSLSNLHSSGGFGSPQHDHSHYHNQSHHPLGYNPSSSSSSSRQAQDPQVGIGIGIGMGRPPPIISLGGKTDISRGNGFNYYYSPSRPQKGFPNHDDSAAAHPHPHPHPVVERVNSVPRSPRKSIWE